MFLTCWHFQNINNENYPNGSILDFDIRKDFGECPASGILKKISQHRDRVSPWVVAVLWKGQMLDTVVTD